MSTPSLIDRYLYYLVHVKKLCIGFGRTTYAQFGEDVVLESLLREGRGVYVDVGAFHPFHYSNTYLLYRRGWSGINIDPNPSAITLFKLHRPRDTSVLSGVGPTVGEANYYMFNHQACNTFSEEQRERMRKKKFVREIGMRRVPIAPLSSILDAYGVGHFDLLNIDVEGMNLEVLRSLDWERHAPRVLCVEDDELDFSNATLSDLDTYVRGKGYLLRARMGLSSIYERVPVL